MAHDQVVLSWNYPDDDSITGYQIRRREKSIHARGEFATHVDDTGTDAPSYTDTNVTANARYVYRVKARNSAGLSPQSSYFDANLPDVPAVSVFFDDATHTVSEGDNVEVAVVLDNDPEREVTIPMSPPTKATLPTTIIRESLRTSSSRMEKPDRS